MHIIWAQNDLHKYVNINELFILFFFGMDELWNLKDTLNIKT